MLIGSCRSAASFAPTAPRAARLVAAAHARGHVQPFEFDSSQGILIKKTGPWRLCARTRKSYGGGAENPRLAFGDPHPLGGLRPSRASPTDRPPACPLNGSALRRVRFSATHKKAGHGCDVPRPAGSSWWRCGESNSGPKRPPGRCLQAQSPVGSRTPRTWRPALGVPAGSVLAAGIPVTSCGAAP